MSIVCAVRLLRILTQMRMSVAGVGALKSALEKVQDYPVCDHSAEAL